MMMFFQPLDWMDPFDLALPFRQCTKVWILVITLPLFIFFPLSPLKARRDGSIAHQHGLRPLIELGTSTEDQMK